MMPVGKTLGTERLPSVHFHANTQYYFGYSSYCNKAWTLNNGLQIENEEVKLSWFIDMIICVKKSEGIFRKYS